MRAFWVTCEPCGLTEAYVRDQDIDTWHTSPICDEGHRGIRSLSGPPYQDIPPGFREISEDNPKKVNGAGIFTSRAQYNKYLVDNPKAIPLSPAEFRDFKGRVREKAERNAKRQGYNSSDHMRRHRGWRQ